MSDDGRSYSDDEFALILKKASEMQAAGPQRSGAKGGGMSLEEIKQIAAEAGIDAEFVDRAAALARQAGGGEGGYWPVPIRGFESVELGAELDDGDLGHLVDIVREVMKEQGKVSEVLDSVEWTQGAGQLSRISVGLTPRDGSTRVQVRTDHSQLAFLTHFLPGMLAVIGTVIVGAEFQPALLPGLAMVGGLWAGAMGIGRTIYGHAAGKMKGQVNQLLERLMVRGDQLAGAKALEAGEASSLPAGQDPEA